MSKAIEKRNEQSIVISIKPTYVDLIMSGQKTVELRRRFSNSMQTGTEICIYSSSPVQSIVGKVSIKKIIKMRIEDLWNEVGKFSGLSYKYFKNYFDGLDEGYGIFLERPTLYRNYIPLAQLSKKLNFYPPQSYMFATH